MKFWSITRLRRRVPKPEAARVVDHGRRTNMRRASIGVAAVAVLVSVSPSMARAAQVTISSYDVRDTPASGFGLWSHSYDGTITPTGRFVAGSVGCPPPPPPELPGCIVQDEIGGSGTLNDGNATGAINATQLLVVGRPDTAGNRIEPTITLHLAEAARIETIRIYGNSFARVDAASIEVGGTSELVTAVRTGTLDEFNLGNTPLGGIVTDTIVVSDFRPAPFFGFPLDQVSISEIVVDSQPADTTPPMITVPPAGVTAEATGPDGALVSFIVGAVDGVDGPVQASCSPAAGSVFPIGDTNVTCTATDSAGNTATAGFTVHVKGGVEQLAELEQVVIGVGPGTSLADKLKQAQAYLAANKQARACVTLGAFIDQVQAQSGKFIEPGTGLPQQAGSLIADAQRIENVLDC